MGEKRAALCVLVPPSSSHSSCYQKLRPPEPPPRPFCLLLLLILLRLSWFWAQAAIIPFHQYRSPSLQWTPSNRFFSSLPEIPSYGANSIMQPSYDRGSGGSARLSGKVDPQAADEAPGELSPGWCLCLQTLPSFPPPSAPPLPPAKSAFPPSIPYPVSA